MTATSIAVARSGSKLGAVRAMRAMIGGAGGRAGPWSMVMPDIATDTLQALLDVAVAMDGENTGGRAALFPRMGRVVLGLIEAAAAVVRGEIRHGREQYGNDGGFLNGFGGADGGKAIIALRRQGQLMLMLTRLAAV